MPTAAHSCLEEHLDLRQVILRVSFEEHPRPFEINLSTRGGDLVAFLFAMSNNLGIGSGNFGVWSLVEERNAPTAGKLADVDAVNRFSLRDRHAGFVVGDVSVFAV